MRNSLISALAVLLLSFLVSSTAIAQDHSRSWDNGHVVNVTEVHIKPGMFNAYVNDLNGLWRKYMEEQKKKAVSSLTACSEMPQPGKVSRIFT